jgi:hypothetical protein
MRGLRLEATECGSWPAVAAHQRWIVTISIGCLPRVRPRHHRVLVAQT